MTRGKKSILITSSILIVLLLTVNAAYRFLLISTDDVLFESFFSGRMSGVPDPHCFFIKYPLAVILSRLFSINANIQWYEIFLFGNNILCVFLLLHRGVKNAIENKKMRYAIYSLLLFGAIVINFIVHVEWTTTAGLLCITGIQELLLPSGKRKIVECLNCYYFFITAYCIRDSVFLMFLPIVVVLVIRKLLSEPMISKKLIRRYIWVCIGGLALIVVLTVGHKLAYNCQNWNDLGEMDSARSKIYDYYGYPNFDENKELYRELGINKETYMLIANDYNFIFLKDKIESKTFNRLAEEAQNQKAIKISIWTIFKRLKSSYSKNDMKCACFIMLFLLLLNILYINKMTRINQITFGLIVALGVLENCYLAYKGRLPYRVLIVFAFGMIVILFCNFIEICERANDHLEKQCLIFTMYMIFFGVIPFNLYNLKINNMNYFHEAQVRSEISHFCKQNKSNVYFRDYLTLSQQGKILFDDNVFDCSNYMMTGGWPFCTEGYSKMRKELMIEDLYEALKSGNRVFYVVKHNKSDEVTQRMNNYFSVCKIAFSASVEQVLECGGEKIDIIKFFCTSNEK